jgi:hypothetical protein
MFLRLPQHRRSRWAATPLLLAGLLPLAVLSAGRADDVTPAPVGKTASAEKAVAPESGAAASKSPTVESVIPAPTEALKDFQGNSIIVLDLPPSENVSRTDDGETVFLPGIAFWVDVNQAYVWPDRVLIERSGQVTLVQASTEIDYNAGVGYIVERTYKNMDRAPLNPIRSLQFSMATYAKLVRQMPNGKLLPDEEPDKLEAEYKARIAALEEKRKTLDKADEIPLKNSISAEMVRLNEDSKMLPFRREHPCVIVQFPNRDVLNTLFSRGFLENRSIEPLRNGTTTFWVTRAEGLPVKMEVTDNKGHMVVFYGFTSLKVNSGMRPGDLAVKAPLGTRRVLVGADVSQKDWEEKMDKALQRQIHAFDAERRRQTAPRVRRP